LVNQSETTEAQQIIFLLRFNNPISDAISSRIFKTSRYLVRSPITRDDDVIPEKTPHVWLRPEGVESINVHDGERPEA
jgi:hypothetical protein